MLTEKQKQDAGGQSRNKGNGHLCRQGFLFPYFHLQYPFFSRARPPFSGPRLRFLRAYYTGGKIATVFFPKYEQNFNAFSVQSGEIAKKGRPAGAVLPFFVSLRSGGP